MSGKSCARPVPVACFWWAVLFQLILLKTVLGQVQDLPIIGQSGGPAMALAIANERLYVGEGSTLKVLDVSNPSLPSELGRIFVDGMVHGIKLVGTRAYVATAQEEGAAGLRVVEVSDPTRMHIVGRFDGVAAYDLDVQGNMVFVTGTTGVTILGVQDISNISAIGFAPSLYAVDATLVDGDTLYTAGREDLRIFDIADPSAPALHKTLSIPDNFDELAIVGDFLYAADSLFGLKTYDVSTPEDAVGLGGYTGTNPNVGANGLTVVGQMAYLVGLRFAILDVSNPAVPVLVSSVPLAGQGRQDSIGAGGDVVVVNELAYVADRGFGVRVFDVSTPTAPVEIATVESGSEFTGIAVQAHYTYLAAGDQMAVYDVSDPRLPSLVANFQTSGACFGVGVRGHTALVDDGGSFHVVDVSNPLAPAGVALVNGLGSNNINNFAFKLPYAFVAEHQGGLQIVDLTTPASPTRTGGATMVNEIVDVFVRGEFAYAAANGFGLRIFDISDPATPQEVGALALLGPTGVFVDGAYCYVTSFLNGLHIIDVSNPALPNEIAVLDLAPAAPESISVRDDIAYLASGIGGLQLVDVSTPANPVLIANADTPGHARDVIVKDFAYVADSANGFVVVAIPPPAPELDPVPGFINADTLTVTGGTSTPGAFVTVGGGREPRFEQLGAGLSDFSIDVRLRQEAANSLSVTTLNEYGLVSLPAIARVVEGPNFPATVETVTALAIGPSPAPVVALNDTLAFTCTASFSDASTADVTEFVTWEEISNGEVITDGGLYVNTKPGAAQVRAFVQGVFSNTVSVTDAP